MRVADRIANAARCGTATVGTAIRTPRVGRVKQVKLQKSSHKRVWAITWHCWFLVNPLIRTQKTKRSDQEQQCYIFCGVAGYFFYTQKRVLLLSCFGHPTMSRLLFVTSATGFWYETDGMWNVQCALERSGIEFLRKLRILLAKAQTVFKETGVLCTWKNAMILKIWMKINTHMTL